MVSRAWMRRGGRSLVLGAATTVIVAWLAMALPRGNAWYGPRTREELGVVEAGDGRLWRVSRGENRWHTVVGYWWMQISGMSMRISREDYERQKFDVRTLTGPLRSRPLEHVNMQAWCHATGWPMRALSCRVEWERQVRSSDIIYRVEGGVQLPRDAKFNPRALPLTPVWPGFVVDAGAYGGAWWGVLAAVAAICGAWRTARGRCPRCGYSRAGLDAPAACPECGAGASIGPT
jgi:hypothetical protein